MDLLELMGYIALTIGCIVIIIKLIMVYSKEKNPLTINGILCFVIASIVFLVAVLASSYLLDVATSMIVWIMFLGLALQFALILDAAKALETPKPIRIVVAIVYFVLVLLGILLPIIFSDAIMNAIILIILLAINTVYFMAVWKKNDDVESFGFAIGLLLIIIGDITMFFYNLAGLFFILCVVVWWLGYFGILEKLMGKE